MTGSTRKDALSLDDDQHHKLTPQKDSHPHSQQSSWTLLEARFHIGPSRFPVWNRSSCSLLRRQLSQLSIASLFPISTDLVDYQSGKCCILSDCQSTC
jgi:hypothetical protein